jgi:hypothetical protein
MEGEVDRKKIAAPGRRSSARVKKFRGLKLIDGIEYDLDARKRRGTDGVMYDMKEEDFAEIERLVAAQEAEEAERARLHAEQAAIEAQAEADVAAAAAEAEAAVRAAEEERQKEEAEEEERRRVQEEEIREQRRAAEARAAQAAEARAAEAQAMAEIEAAKERKKAEQAAAWEAEERAQAEAQERAQARAQAEAEAKAAAEVAARKAAEEAAAAEEELQRVIAEERSKRESVRIQKEKEEQEKRAAEAAAEEEARRRKLEQAAASAKALSEAEDAELAAKRKRAEEQRKKREKFLSDMDNFEDDFQTKVQEAKERRESLAAQEEALMREQLAAASMGYTAPKKSAGIADEADEVKPDVKIATHYAMTEETKPTELEPRPLPVEEKKGADEKAIRLHGKSDGQFDSVAASLFASGEVSSELKGASPTDDAEGGMGKKVDFDEELRMPTRIGSTGKGKFTAQPAAKERESSSPTRPSESSRGNTQVPEHLLKGVKFSSEDIAEYPDGDDEEEEGNDAEISGLSAFLTKEERRGLSKRDRAAWRALHSDMNSRRKDFHGAVTYAFDGIFSWQMYGSAEAVDETGKSYTEYLMRCQWGTTWDNMQPWISARRYREFDLLDKQLRSLFPALKHKMVRLPEKDFFFSLESHVIQHRRACLEEYMVKIVSSLPTLLRSEELNEFLGIGERIQVIKAKLTSMGEESTVTQPQQRVSAPNDSTITDPDYRPSPFDAPRNGNGNLRGNSSSGSSGQEGPSSPQRQATQQQQEERVIDTDAEVSNSLAADPDLVHLTIDSAENVRAAEDSAAFDDNELGQLEEDVKMLGMLLREATPDVVAGAGGGGPIRDILVQITNRWPRLRATAVVGTNIDFSLIPRAMQTEEDLVRLIDDYRSLKAAHLIL